MAATPYSAEHRRRRKHFARQLAAGHAIQCGCTGQCQQHGGRCDVQISHGMAWHLGHPIARVHGGRDADSTPWCVECNLADAGLIGPARQAGGWSRDW